MRRGLFAFSCFLCLAVVRTSSAADYPDRWVFAWNDLNSSKQLDELLALTDTAKSLDMNGFVLFCGYDFGGRWDDVRTHNCGNADYKSKAVGLDCLHLWNPERLGRLRQLVRKCRESGLDFVPIVWSPGYCSMQLHDPNMVAVFPIRDVPYRRKGEKAHYVRPSYDFANGSLDEAGSNGVLFAGWVNDTAGEQVFRDTDVRRTGEASARIEARSTKTMSRIRHHVSLRPNRRYRVSAWVKTKDLPRKGPSIRVYGTKDEKELQVAEAPIVGTRDWTQFECFFNSQDVTEADVYIGLWFLDSGTMWLDDVEFEAVGAQQVVRREGTPVRIVDADTGVAYREGRDYLPFRTIKALMSVSSPASEPLEVPADSTIPEGARLLVSYYEPVPVCGVQFSACLSNPELKKFYQESARRLEEVASPRSWLLSADEVRVGCRCELCRASGKSRGELLAGTVCDQRAAVRAVHPDAKLYAWADMFDDNHNALDKYYLCDSTYKGCAKLLPKDITLVSWWDEKCEASFELLSSLGFQTMAGMYYDLPTKEATVSQCHKWLKGMDKTPGNRGYIYITWGARYDMLPAFVEAMRQNSNPVR